MKKLLVVVIVAVLLLSPIQPIAADASEPEVAPALPGWAKLSPTVAPSPRTDIALAYDTARGMAVMFGGFTQQGDYLNDTWEFDSATLTWVERFPLHRPPPRYGAALAYDAARGVTMLFGGWSAFTFEMNDTWLWDGSDWTQVFPQVAPSPRWKHNMVYDSQRQIVLMFGGNHSYEDSLTWEWDGLNWSIPAIIQPSAWRDGVALAYDTRRNTFVAFGGGRSIQPYFFAETWERAGASDWVRRFPQSHPSARERAASTYFPQYRSTIIYGGIIAPNAITDETWAWTGQRWFKLPLDPHPTGGCAVMVYDPIQRGLLLYIGCSVPGVAISETWLLR